MANTASDTRFAGSIPALYDEHLVPMIFAPYAAEIAARVAALAPRRVLETAAGTGAVTRAMARTLPAGTELVATDLNQPMLDRAAATGAGRPVQWRQADAMQLPFEDERFDAVVCQFGAMFFPDRPAAYAEARRVLRPGGVFLFDVWDRLEDNEFAEVVTAALAGLFPDDPPRFMARVPHGYFDRATIEGDLAQAGFAASPGFDTLAARSRAATPHDVASPTARARPCATRSRPAPPTGCRARRRCRPRRSPGASATGRSTAGCRRTSSPRAAEIRRRPAAARSRCAGSARGPCRSAPPCGAACSAFAWRRRVRRRSAPARSSRQ